MMNTSRASAAPSAAFATASSNFDANAEALRLTQPRLCDGTGTRLPDVEWVFGRDGALTGMEPVDRWWAGCSVPARAAAFMLKGMSVVSISSCFLAPVHASQLRVALDRLDASQTILAIVPEPKTLDVILHCENFSADIVNHRLWFVCGRCWQADLEKLLYDNPGLPTPSEFIRPIRADSGSADALIAPALRFFADVAAARSETTRSVTMGWKRKATIDRICVVSPSRFRLWDDAGGALADLADASEFGQRGVETKRFDSDNPISASPFALATELARCDAVVTPNVGRGDLPGIAADEFPWTTWVTVPRVPPWETAGPNDRLLVADPSWKILAAEAGWPADRVGVAIWPSRRLNPPDPSGSLCLVGNTRKLDPPDRVKDFSSHLLLWDLIREELTQNPLSLGTDVEQYLKSRRARLQIAEAGFDAGIFVDQLIVPAYGQGVARLLVKESLPLVVHGSGWETCQSIAEAHAGPVESRDHLDRIISGSAALIHAWPTRQLHPIESYGRPVIRALGQTHQGLLHAVRQALKGSASPILRPGSELGPGLILDLLHGLRPSAGN